MQQGHLPVPCLVQAPCPRPQQGNRRAEREQRGLRAERERQFAQGRAALAPFGPSERKAALGAGPCSAPLRLFLSFSLSAAASSLLLLSSVFVGVFLPRPRLVTTCSWQRAASRALGVGEGDPLSGLRPKTEEGPGSTEANASSPTRGAGDPVKLKALRSPCLEALKREEGERAQKERFELAWVFRVCVARARGGAGDERVSRLHGLSSWKRARERRRE